MSTPDFRQPDPAASLRGALAAQARVTDALREAAAELREEGDTLLGAQLPPKPTGEKQP